MFIIVITFLDETIVLFLYIQIPYARQDSCSRHKRLSNPFDDWKVETNVGENDEVSTDQLFFDVIV